MAKHIYINRHPYLGAGNNKGTTGRIPGIIINAASILL